MNDISERSEMIRYPKFRSKRWQFGNGPTEAARQTLITRLMGSGMS